VSLLTVLSTADTHYSGMASGQLPGIHQKRSMASRFAWSMDYHVWSVMLDAYYKLHSQPNSTIELNEVLQVIWDSLAQEAVNKAVKKLHAITEEMCRSWRWTIRAHKVNVEHQTKCSLCRFSDIVLLCLAQSFSVCKNR